MPTRTLTIPLTTLPIGQTTFGPMNVGNNSRADMVTDRTVAGALNSLTSSSTVAILIQTSADTGATWHDLCGATWVGGIYTSRVGQLNADKLGTGDIAAAVNRVQIIATVAGPSPVVIAGTVTVT